MPVVDDSILRLLSYEQSFLSKFNERTWHRGAQKWVFAEGTNISTVGPLNARDSTLVVASIKREKKLRTKSGLVAIGGGMWPW